MHRRSPTRYIITPEEIALSFVRNLTDADIALQIAPTAADCHQPTLPSSIFVQLLSSFGACRAEHTASSCCERSLPWLHMWSKKFLNIHTVLVLIAFTKDDHNAALWECEWVTFQIAGCLLFSSLLCEKSNSVYKKPVGRNVFFFPNSEQMAHRFCASFVNYFKVYLSIPKRLLESTSAFSCNCFHVTWMRHKRVTKKRWSPTISLADVCENLGNLSAKLFLTISFPLVLITFFFCCYWKIFKMINHSLAEIRVACISRDRIFQSLGKINSIQNNPDQCSDVYLPCSK